MSYGAQLALLSVGVGLFCYLQYVSNDFRLVLLDVGEQLVVVIADVFHLLSCLLLTLLLTGVIRCREKDIRCESQDGSR